MTAGITGSTSPTRGVALDQTLDYGGTTSILVRDVGNKVFYLDPSAAPFTLLTNKAGDQKASQTKFEWYEKALRTKAFTVSTTSSGTDDTVILQSDPTVAQVGDIIYMPVSAEYLRVSSVGTTDITVVRDLDGSVGGGGYSWAAGVDAFIIGNAQGEGADVNTPDE